MVLATGARERPRAARLIPGTRPAGVFTTGQLQQWVHRQHLAVGRRALIVGAEHVSYSAVLTLRDAGVHPVALVTDLPASQTYRAFDILTRAGLRVPVWTHTSVAGIYGKERVERVLLRGPGGDERTVAVDTVVFTGDFVADNELARQAGLAIDPGTGGPACDADGRTTAEGVFAAGNVVHPAETADVAARRAHKVGQAAARWLRGGGEAAAPDAARCACRSPAVGGPEPDRRGPGQRRADADRSRTFLTALASRSPRRSARGLLPPAAHDPQPFATIPSEWQRRLRSGEDVWISVSSTEVDGLKQLTSGPGSSPSGRRTRPR